MLAIHGMNKRGPQPDTKGKTYPPIYRGATHDEPPCADGPDTLHLPPLWKAAKSGYVAQSWPKNVIELQKGSDEGHGTQITRTLEPRRVPR